MNNQTINPPDLDDLLAESRNSLLANFNCVQIGRLEKINDNQTVEISIQFLRRLPDGKTGKYPLLIDCPYFVLNGGLSYVDMPIIKGDYCLVLFNDRNIDDWWDTANVSIPPDTRKHSIADGIAIVGVNPVTTALTRAGDAMRLIGPGGSGNSVIVQLTEDGKFKIDCDSDMIANVGGDLSATVAGKTDLESTGDVTATTPNFNIIGKLNVTDLVTCEKDVIANNAIDPVSVTNHPHRNGNLGYDVGIPIGTVTGTVNPKPAGAPSGDASGNIDMNGLDILNVKNSAGGTTSFSTHYHFYTWTDPAGSGNSAGPT